MTKDELIELAQVGMGIHSPNQPEYIVCEALIKALAQPEQKPVAWGFQNSAITGSNRWMMLREQIPTNDQYGGALWTPLYTTPLPCQTCEALARTVMMDQTGRDA